MSRVKRLLGGQSIYTHPGANSDPVLTQVTAERWRWLPWCRTALCLKTCASLAPAQEGLDRWYAPSLALA